LFERADGGKAAYQASNPSERSEMKSRYRRRVSIYSKVEQAKASEVKKREGEVESVELNSLGGLLPHCFS